jgi:Predicted Zn-dependent peptidases
MEQIYYSTLKETLYHQEFKNGLNVYVLPKRDFSKTYALFATPFGSIDTSFVPLNHQEMIKVEDGIAHFLEHKMFENKDGDVSDVFSKLGASTNAFTSSTRTAYLFSTSSNELKCIETLIDFVQELYLTDESVEKEKGIIAQEIKMYDDNPDWRNYFDSIKNLYHHHPINKDIAGTIETVNATTREMLEMSYQTFYHPSQMVLFIVGNIEAEEVFNFIELNQEKKKFLDKSDIILKKIKEPKSVVKKQEILKMEVTSPKLMVAMKINNIISDPYLKLKRELSMNILLDMLFSKSSEIYQEWQKEGLIDGTFGADFTQERDYAFIQIGGDTNQLELLKDKILTIIEKMNDYLIDEETFKRLKRKIMGIFVNTFNSPEAIANLFIKYYFEGSSAFELVDILEDINIDDLKELLTLFDKELISISIVEPINTDK